MDYFRLRGIGVSPGIALGEVSLTERILFSSRKETISPSRDNDECKRLNKAFKRTREQLSGIRENVKKKMGEGHSIIFQAHQLILEDPSLISDMQECIRNENTRAEWAISQANERYRKLFESHNVLLFLLEVPLTQGNLYLRRLEVKC